MLEMSLHSTTVLPKRFSEVLETVLITSDRSNQLLWSVLSSVKFTKLFISNTSSRSKMLAQFSLERPHLHQPKIHTYRSCPRVTLCMEVIIVICVPTSAMTSPCEQACGSIEALRFFNHPRWVLREPNQVQALSSCRHCFWCMQLASFIQFLINAVSLHYPLC